MIEYYLPRSIHLSELYLIHYGMEECSAGHYYGPAVRDHYLLHYITAGRGMFKAAGQTYQLEQGQGFLIYPNTVTYYEADLHNPWSYCWVGFNGLLVETLLRKCGLTEASPIFRYDRDHAVERCITEMTEIHLKSKARDIHLTSKIYELMAILVANNPHEEPVASNKRHQLYVEEAVQFIEMNFANKITVAEIARNIGLNRSYLNALFKKQMNMSIQDYLIRYRIERACDLMTNDLLAIGDIARSVGYDDPLLFSKMFKKIRGCAPSQYRQQLSR